MNRHGVVKYKVWVHIEGLNKDGDMIEGDDYFEPHEAACVKSAKRAMEIQNRLVDSGHNLES